VAPFFDVVVFCAKVGIATAKLVANNTAKRSKFPRTRAAISLPPSSSNIPNPWLRPIITHAELKFPGFAAASHHDNVSVESVRSRNDLGGSNGRNWRGSPQPVGPLWNIRPFWLRLASLKSPAITHPLYFRTKASPAGEKPAQARPSNGMPGRRPLGPFYGSSSPRSLETFLNNRWPLPRNHARQSP
jgi:hypothetical protein